MKNILYLPCDFHIICVFQMCLERETSWQAKEGAVMGKLLKANENHTLKLHCRCISVQVYY